MTLTSAESNGADNPTIRTDLHVCGGCSLDWSEQLACTPHRVCDDPSLFCVESDAGAASCERLLDPEIGCTDTYPSDITELIGENVLVVGVLAQWPSPSNPSAYGVPTTQAIQVAISGINAGPGIAVHGEQARKLLAVVCNEGVATQGDATDQAPRIEHLVGRLRAPAILGGSTSGVTRRVNEVHLKGRDTLLLSPSSTDDTLTDFWRDDASGRERQLFFRTVAPNSQQAPALASAYKNVRSAILAANLGYAGEPLDAVGIFDPSNPSSRNLHNVLSHLLEDLNATVTFRMGDKTSETTAVQAILALAPHVIVPLGTGEFLGNPRPEHAVDGMLHGIEEAWPAERPRPWYMVFEGNRANFRGVLEHHPGLVDRLIGTTPGARSSALYSNFRNDFVAYFQDHTATLDGSRSTPGNLAEQGYDAAYLLAYASVRASARGAWPRGGDLARAIEALGCKSEGARSLKAERLEYSADADALARDPRGCFDFAGASGPLDYADSQQSDHRPKSLEPNSDIGLWCLGHPTDPEDQTENLIHHFYEDATGTIEASDDAGQLDLKRPGWCSSATRPQR